ncbi:hypothetical protein E2562_012737 [Oryza meyeriana var. granulata]|uniref:Uncharacterized protein n=1 Tax=Oryza meyeriana var. granulata TaxID=110450 RepID=A0A6G1DHF8_9ORYZ|nr:hypothetical protein E2562_012737 [Oryza meyeriana var. granulata]
MDACGSGRRRDGGATADEAPARRRATGRRRDGGAGREGGGVTGETGREVVMRKVIDMKDYGHSEEN